QPHDLAADRTALAALARYCQRFSPWVAVEQADAPDCLLLDITGCAHLFGGEAAMADMLAADFASRGYTVRIAVADTLGAAWALARSQEPWGRKRGAKGECLDGQHSAFLPFIVASGAQAEALRPLPVTALRLAEATLHSLREFDLTQIGQLLDLPRADVVSHFGQETLLRLDQALGNVPELPTFEEYVEPLEASWQFEWPVADRRLLQPAMEHLLKEMIDKLRPRNLGVQRLRCTLTMTAGPAMTVDVGLLRASASLPHLMELLSLHWERVFSLAGGQGNQAAATGAEVLGLSMAVAAAPLEFHQGQLWDSFPFPAEGAMVGSEPSPAQRRQDFLTLIERLSSRLGEAAVVRPRLWPDWQPELAWRAHPWLSDAQPSARTQPTPENIPVVVPRPLVLSPRPVAVAVWSLVPEGPPLHFRWQGRGHDVARCWGPERIETGWWRDRDVRRDYYRVETTDGQRHWLFHDRAAGAWHWQGCFA
ncbi:MAG: DNA polymerase Y family protein, partial [Gemmataceae bacterium]|nr:DNA polymerase Y family protein [Gemmataceae bacterium]